MRITTMRRGSLAATCLLLGIANGQPDRPNGTPENSNIKFTIPIDNGKAILLADPSVPTIRSFKWESPGGALVNEIYLQSALKNKTIGTASRETPPMTTTTTTVPNKSGFGLPTASSSTSTLASMGLKHPVSSVGAGEVPTGPGRRRQPHDFTPVPPLLMNMSSEGTGGEVSFDLALLTDNEGLGLFFMALWGNGGKSYSRKFTVVFSQPAQTQAINSGDFENPEPFAPEKDVMNGDDGSIDTTPISTATPKPGNTVSGGSGNSGGLGQGTIIGIAVACGVVGLLLVFAIVWFVVRRQKQKQNLRSGGSYNAENRGEDLIAEKEASAGVDVTPHSPYSDDGGAGGAANPGYQEDSASAIPIAAAGAAAHHRQDRSRSYTPYSDRPGAATSPSIRTASISHNDEARANMPSPIPGRATPRGLTTPYAHLVEEGMTEEEIRRLEEEERQLDAAIEQAGRR